MWEHLAPALAMERRLAWYDAIDAWRARSPCRTSWCSARRSDATSCGRATDSPTTNGDACPSCSTGPSGCCSTTAPGICCSCWADDAAQKIAVEFDYRVGGKKDGTALNMIVSAYRQAVRDIDGEVKGGVWVPVE